jgi:UTP:GlnB (protein PII) uridylyltransferase
MANLSHDVTDISQLRLSVMLLCKQRGLEEGAVALLVNDAPPSWWNQADAETLGSDLALLAPGIGPEGVRIRISPTDSDMWDLAIVTMDRIGAFATTCSTLADFGVSIGKARVASWSDHGLALQHLTVVPFETPRSGEPDWPTIGLGLRASLTQPDLGVSVRASLPDGAGISRITSENSAGPWTVEVTGPDTMGLLAAITRAFTSLGADILAADAVSTDGVAFDTFSLKFSDAAGEAALRAMAPPGLPLATA